MSTIDHLGNLSFSFKWLKVGLHSPKVRSYGRFVCNICDNDYGSKDELNMHIDSTHTPKPRQEASQGTADQLNDEDDVLELAKEDQDLYDELEFLINNVIDQEKEEGDKDIDKVKRLMNVLNKKADIQKETNEVVKESKLVQTLKMSQSTLHDGSTVQTQTDAADAN